MQKINKENIGKRFKKATATYDEYAVVQKMMAQELVSMLKNHGFSSFGTVYEIGTGTGILTKIVSTELKYEQLFCNDLFGESYNYISGLCDRKCFLAGDGESVELIPGNTDLIISNATFQWFEDLPEFLKCSSQKISKNGVIAFSTFGTAQFKEIREITGNGLHYFTKDELLSRIGNCFELVYFGETRQVLHFRTFREILIHISRTGVAGVGEEKNIELKEFARSYTEKFFSDGNYRLTYDPQIWILRRKQ
ncbi:MAG TPA: methyltransferase domain-containing protein [bacterium]|nr:methyltransferase domain-containing protein [bacterium]